MAAKPRSKPRQQPKAHRYRAIPEYYDAEYAHLDFLQQDVPFFLQHLPARRRMRVLEIAAGTGRAAIPIAQAGHRVVGVDYDPAVLAIARRKRNHVGLSEQELSLICQDVQKLRLAGMFDWACIFFNTLLAFPTLAEQGRLLRRIHAHLKPRGRVWIDIFNPDLALISPEHLDGVDPVQFYVPELDRVVMKTTDIRRLESTRQIQRLTFRYHWIDADGTAHEQRSVLDLTYLYARELQLLLERYGFAIEHLYGDYDGSSPTDGSPRLIACARRR